MEAALGRIVAGNLAEWYALHEGVPGAEVHRDPDITWMLQEGRTWFNGGASLRFKPRAVDRRLDRILARFAKHGRGIGFWVDADAGPADIEDRLRQRGFRCRKRFPGMWCDLASAPEVAAPSGIRIIRMPHHAMYLRHPHPYFGPITTPIRRYELNRLAHLAAAAPGSFFDLVALAEGNRPVGAGTMFLGELAAGFYDVGVLPEERNRGIGSALIAHGLRVAREQGKSQAVLIASGMGFRMYQRLGFREVCRVAYWHRA